MKKFIFLTAVLFVFFSAVCCLAKDEQIFQSYIIAADGGRINTTAFSESGDLWIEADALRKAGTALETVLDGKCLAIQVKNPDEVFGIPALKQLTGGVLRLAFRAADVQKVKYINVSGLEKLTGCFVEKANGLPYVRVLPKEVAAFPAKNDTELKKPVIMAWEYGTTYCPDLEKEPVISGLDIISPCWFYLAENSGLISNRASASYAAEAHRRGMKIWALTSNSFNKQITKEFFKNSQAKKQFIAQLLAFSKLYGLDGINFDFERVDVADRDAYTQLVSEAAPYLKEADLVVSVDVHKPANTNMSKSHDRKALGAIVDYVMLMAYDQHWAGCPTAGSVADLPWTKYAVYLTLQEVPAEKLLLGIPFYMRRWRCTPLAGGKEKVKGYTLTMEQSDELIRKHKLTPVWLADKKQDYYEFKENGQIIKVWVENRKSLAARADLIKEYNLAGAACWRKGHEQPYAWKTLHESLHGSQAVGQTE